MSPSEVYPELLRVGWLMAWRGAAMNALLAWLALPVLSLGFTGILSSIGLSSWVPWIVQGVGFLILPIAIHLLLLQMALTKQFRGFHLETVAADGRAEDWSLRESVLPALTLTVVGLVGSVIVAIPLGLASGFLLGAQNGAIAGMILGAAGSVMVSYPAAVFLLLHVRFHGRRLTLVRGGELAIGPEGMRLS